ncbi:MAG: DUF3152 domain-containing protein [Corynebacterium sp.]|nr:DUF3152 domain-containing protein [Corynebacterium sp.]
MSQQEPPAKQPRQANDSFFVRFAREYGWRAYAIPVLLVITIWVFVDILRPSPDAETTAEATNSSSGTLQDSPNPVNQEPQAIAESELPAGGAFTTTGAGTYRKVGSAGASVGLDNESVFRYIVEIEDGIDTTTYGGDDAFAAMVDATLSNQKSWSGGGRFGFEHVADASDADLRIQLTSTNTTHSLCGNSLGLETSCFYSDGGRVIINDARWVRGAVPFAGDLGSYRQYLINHEVGHGIGFAEHEPCASTGELAPIMMQQTISLSNDVLAATGAEEAYDADGAVCVANPWPYPYGGA